VRPGRTLLESALTAVRDDLTMRPITGPDELDLFCELPYQLDDELAGDLREGRRRPDWLWLALRGDRPVARLAWWARAGGAEPLLLDVFDLAGAAPDRVEVGARLLATASAGVLPAGRPWPDYQRYLPPGWRDDPAVRPAVEELFTALASTGARPLVERLRLGWEPPAPVPAAAGRLAFRPVRDRDDLLDLMTPVLDGTLDAHSRRGLAGKPPRQVAAEHYDEEFAGYTSPRSWWQVATLPDSEPVGFVVPAHNGYHPIIAYLGVLPAYRGRGYIHEILAEGTRILVAAGAPRIRASTDVGNVPMANAFHRAGYVTRGEQVDMVWS
jgi:RimJ/RimL family protein N-acetyltransferase